MIEYKFFALISRMRYINRWGLMRNTFQENIQEHRLSQGQIGVISAPICPFYRRSFDGFSVVSV